MPSAKTKCKTVGRKESDMERFGISLDEDLYQSVQKIAKKENLTMGQVVAFMMADRVGMEKASPKALKVAELERAYDWVRIYNWDEGLKGIGYRKEDDQLVLMERGEIAPTDVLSALKWLEAVENGPGEKEWSGGPHGPGKFLKQVLALASPTLEIPLTPEMKVCAGLTDSGDVVAWAQGWIRAGVEADFK